MLGPEQAVGPETMLRWYTRGSAALSFDEGRRGAIAPGMLADLIAVEPDPLCISPDELPDVRVRLTIVDGRIAYEA